MIVDTTYGKVRGLREEGMLAFKGIPYAKAPTGPLRFKPPAPRERWEGVLEATAYGNRAMQQHREPGYAYDEDCLNLNIWTPSVDGASRPVIFFIHGGGHFEGSNSDPFSTGARLVRGKDAIVVSPNYRLGAFGYLHLGDILGEGFARSGNCGLLDQLFALQWVRANIAAFGGDPERITLMGQSAGGKSVASLLVTPLAQGLFRQAIIQSGSVQCIKDRATATNLARYIVETVGQGDEASCDIAAQAERLLTMSAEQLLEIQIKAYERISPAHLFGPVIDGHTFDETPESYISSGKLRSTPVLIGYCKEELAPADGAPDFDEATLADRLFYVYGHNGEYLLEKYRALRALWPAGVAFGKLQTQYVYGNASLALTQLLAENGCETWCYRWDFTGAVPPIHSSEMPYLFGVSQAEREDGYLPEHSHMAELLRESWMAFAFAGDPNQAAHPRWPSCSSGQIGYRMIWDKEPYVEPINMQAFDKQFPMQVIQLSDNPSSGGHSGLRA